MEIHDSPVPINECRQMGLGCIFSGRGPRSCPGVEISISSPGPFPGPSVIGLERRPLRPLLSPAKNLGGTLHFFEEMELETDGRQE